MSKRIIDNQNHSQWANTRDVSKFSNSTKNYCPNCGGDDLDIEFEIVTGLEGRIEKALCRKCNHRF